MYKNRFMERPWTRGTSAQGCRFQNGGIKPQLALFMVAWGLAFFSFVSANEPAAAIENATVDSVPSPQEVLEQQHQSAVNLARSGERKEALVVLEQLHKQNPSEIKITLDYILVLAWDEQWQLAVDQFEQLPPKAERPVYLLKEVAKAYGALGKKEQELAFYTQVLEQDPQDISSRQALFLAAMSLGRYDVAGQGIDELIKGDPKNKEYLFQKAECLWMSKGPLSSVLWLNQSQDVLEERDTEVFLRKMTSRLSDPQWEEIGEWFSKTSSEPLSVADAALGLAWVNHSASGQRDFLSHKNVFLGNFDRYPESMQFDVAARVESLGLVEEAKGLYRKILKQYPSNINAIERLAKILMTEDADAEAMKLVEQGLEAHPDAYALLLIKGELLERQKDFVGAIKCYNRILELFPGNQAAFNLKMRALMDLGGNSLAVELMEKSAQPVDPVLLERGKGNLEMNYVRWEEPQAALTLANRTLKLPSSAPKDQGSSPQEKKMDLDSKAVQIEINRARWDKILALSENQQFDEVLDEYNKARSEKLEIPLWIEVTVADAYLYKREPLKALEIYQAAHEQQPKSFKVDMALYYALVDLGRYQEATDLLNEIDRELPAQILRRGILSDNWQKAEVTYNKVWLLMYQDRLAEAQKLALEYLKTSPANTQLRTVLAHVYLWRGWPRQALKEFQMVQNMDYENIPATNGYARSLYDNVKKQDARKEINMACEKYPRNRHVQRARRLIEVDDQPFATFSGYYYTEHPGEDEFLFSLRGDQPVTDHHQIFAEIVRRETTHSEGKDITDRTYLGDIWRTNNMWKLTGAFSLDETTGKDAGGLGAVELTPDDFWTFGLGYDSYSLDVPLHSRVTGVTAQDFYALARFRASESFNTQLGAGFKDFSDGNENYNYLWTTDTALTTAAYWKTRLQTEFGYSTFSRQDVNYFSPEYLYDFYLIPMVEHTWRRRYEKAWVDRLYLGLGQQWQKGFGAENVGYIRYELDHRYSDTFSALVGVTYSLKNYDDADVNGLTIYWTLRKHF
jgi:biofilm PGA synthesis protein PgaA